VQVPLRFNYLFALEPIYLNIKGIDLLLIIIIEQLEYTPPLFWTRPVKPRLITYQLLYDATVAFRPGWACTSLVAMVECAAIEAMALVTAWPSLRKVSKGHQSASEAALIILET